MGKKQPKAKNSNTIQTNNRSKLAILGLVFLAFLLIISKCISVISSFSEPMGLPANSVSKYSWDGQTAINIILARENGMKDNPLYVVNFDPQDPKITILKIPPQTYMELPRGYGFWKVESIYDLGQEEKVPNGSQLLELAIGDLIGLPIDGLMLVTSKEKQNVNDIVLNLRNNKFTIPLLLSHIKSDLTPSQMSKLLWAMSNVRSDKIVSLNLEQSSITNSKLLPDSSRVLAVNTVKLDLFIRGNLADDVFLQEDKTVAVFNATSHPGLTHEVSRMVTNLGGSVTMILNTETLNDKTYIYVADNEITKSLSYQRLARIIAPNCLEKPCQTIDPKVLNSRAQINIILGEDYYKYWYQR